MLQSDLSDRGQSGWKQNLIRGCVTERSISSCSVQNLLRISQIFGKFQTVSTVVHSVDSAMPVAMETQYVWFMPLCAQLMELKF